MRQVTQISCCFSLGESSARFQSLADNVGCQYRKGGKVEQPPPPTAALPVTT